MRKINPSVKAITILICALLISFHYSVIWNLVIIGVCVVGLLSAQAKIQDILLVLLPATLASVSIFMALLLHGKSDPSAAGEVTLGFLQMSTGAGGLNDALAVALRIYAYAFLGMLFSFTTDAQEFLYSLMQQCRLSPKYAYGVLAAYHLIPMIGREYRQIRLAYQVRGISLKPWSLKPAFPALVNAMHWAESVAMAMESKGFDEDGKRTLRMTFTVKGYDYLWAACMVLLSIAPLLIGNS